jgi:hypothetical protein
MCQRDRNSSRSPISRARPSAIHEWRINPHDAPGPDQVFQSRGEAHRNRRGGSDYDPRDVNSPGRNGLEASAARSKLGFIIADIGQEQWVLHRHAAGLFDKLDKLLDTQRFLISGARAASRWKTVRCGLGLNQSQLLGIGRRRGTEYDRRRKGESGKEAGASGGQGGLLTLVLKLCVGRVSLSESSLRLTMTLPSDVELTGGRRQFPQLGRGSQ